MMADNALAAPVFACGLRLLEARPEVLALDVYTGCMAGFDLSICALAILPSASAEGVQDLDPSRIVTTNHFSPSLHPVSHSGEDEFRIVRASWIWRPAFAGFTRYTGFRYEPSRQAYEYFLTSLPSEQAGDDYFECESDGVLPREVAVLEIRPRTEPDNFIRVYERDTKAFLRRVNIPRHWTLRRCADLDADGLDDFLLQDAHPHTGNFLGLRGYDGARIGQVEVLGDGPVDRFVLGQFDRDPSLEILTVHSNQNGRWCAIADLETGRYVSHYVGYWENLRVADVNLDGRDEIVVGRWQFSHFGISSFVDCWDVAWWWQLWTIPVNDYRLMEAKDLDGNGTIEVLTKKDWSADYEILHGGTGLPAVSYSPPASRGWPVGVFAADADKDGSMEFVWEMEAWGENYTLITDARTGAKEWEERGYVDEWRSLDVGDLDHDGRVDVLAVDGSEEESASIALLDAETFQDRTTALDRDFYGIAGCAAVDVDGDGWDEALVVERSSGGSNMTQVKIYRWNGSRMNETWAAWSSTWDAFEGEYSDTIDLENDGDAELLVGMNSIGNPDREVLLLSIVDYPSGLLLRQWQTNLLAVRVLDHDEDGDDEVIELGRDYLIVRDPRTGSVVERMYFGVATSLGLGRNGGHGLVLVGTKYGAVHCLETSPQGLLRTLRIQAASQPIRSLAIEDVRGLVFTAADGVARVHDGSTGALLHESQQYLYNFGRDLRVIPGLRPAFVVSDDYTLYRFDVP